MTISREHLGAVIPHPAPRNDIYFASLNAEIEEGVKKGWKFHQPVLPGAVEEYEPNSPSACHRRNILNT